MRDRALFDLAIDSKLRGCDLVKIKIGTLVTGQEIRTRAMVVQQRTGVRYSSRSRAKSGQACLLGLNGEAEQLTTTPFPLESIMPIISALASMPDWSMSG